MLAAYGRSLTTAQALRELFGVTQDGFEADYRRYIATVLAAAGGSLARPKPTLVELQTRAGEDPNDADAVAELARAWLDRDDKPQARKFALAAQKLRPQHPLAAYVLARLQLTIGDSDAAITLLAAALDRDAPHEDVLALLAALKLQASDRGAAQELYELGDAKLPHSDRWIKGLVKIHLLSGDNASLAPALERLLKLEPENAAARKKLTQLALAAKDYAATETMAWQGIYADVQDASAHRTLAAALAGQNKHAQAVAEYQTALRLDDQHADDLAALATSLVALDKLDEARETITKLRKLDASHSQLPTLEKAVTP
jgi:tetratricopeptide (TPR) repeat protein